VEAINIGSSSIYVGYNSGSLGFRMVKVRNLPRIARINTKKQLVKIRVIRGEELTTWQSKNANYQRATIQ
jgi:hypothetical protein